MRSTPPNAPPPWQHRRNNNTSTRLHEDTTETKEATEATKAAEAHGDSGRRSSDASPAASPDAPGAYAADATLDAPEASTEAAEAHGASSRRSSSAASPDAPGAYAAPDASRAYAAPPHSTPPNECLASDGAQTSPLPLADLNPTTGPRPLFDRTFAIDQTSPPHPVILRFRPPSPLIFPPTPPSPSPSPEPSPPPPTRRHPQTRTSPPLKPADVEPRECPAGETDPSACDPAEMGPYSCPSSPSPSPSPSPLRPNMTSTKGTPRALPTILPGHTRPHELRPAPSRSRFKEWQKELAKNSSWHPTPTT